MKSFFILCLTGFGGLAWAQTNGLVPKQPAPELVVTSQTGYFDGKTSQMIYRGDVFVTDHVKAKLYCEQLTVDVPRDGGHLTNIVAETNVVIDYVDSKGDTNHLTADLATYAYSLATNAAIITTNETATFTRFPGRALPKMENVHGYFIGDPLIYDFVAQQFIATSNFETHFNLKPGSGTNASPFNLLK